MNESRRKVRLLALSALHDLTTRKHRDSAHGLYRLKAYAQLSDEVRRGFVIQVGNILFRDRLAAPSLWLDPDVEVLGLTCQPWSLPWVERVIDAARELRPDIRIWIGGSSAPHLLARGQVSWSERDLFFFGDTGRAEEPFRQAFTLQP